ncbi:DUF3182 family protein [Variovorax sp. HJSM1_2]|uniref:DUF3182 family protein n=1 Tax=Variovorax sp. HJSM1_2 TaxID=3366263 RepID=UPI003BCFAC82
MLADAVHRPLDPVLPQAEAHQELVMPFTQGLEGHASLHENATRHEIAKRIARLKGGQFSAEIPVEMWAVRPYLVPSETLVGVRSAEQLGVLGEDDFLGGVVPQAFVATKAITHPLVSRQAAAPKGWSHDFPSMVADAVLPGLTAFSRQDALQAAEQMLRLGPVRIKAVWETGGRGQSVAADMGAAKSALAEINDAVLAEHGVVLEHDLSNVETLSIGQVRVAGIVASYHGTQKLTPNNTGSMAYGGSDLTVVRGGFEALLDRTPAGPLRMAVDQALLYDTAVRACFPGFFASRTNYDVAQGLNAAGRWCSGVLEQSWRIGGATPAEIAALEALHADPELQTVRVSCTERYGPHNAPSGAATVYFQGEDPEVGLLIKYAEVEIDGNKA